MSTSHTLGCSFVPSPVVQSGEVALDIELKDWDTEGDRPTTLAFYGWVASRVGKPVAIELVSDRVLIVTGRFTVERPDVVAALGWADRRHCGGYHLRVSKLSLRPTAVVEMVLVQEDTDGHIQRIPLSTIENLPRVSLKLQYREKCCPLLVTGLGRSGTTFLIGHLATWPEISVPQIYPYELKIATHLLRAARVLVSPAAADQDVGPEEFSPAATLTVGPDPFMTRDWEKAFGSSFLLDWHENLFPNRCIDFFKASIDRFVASRCHNSAPKFFAEKSFVSQTRTFISNVYGNFKEIILVRDFRDAFVSAAAFNRKRGTADFGEALYDNSTDWLRSWETPVRLLHAAAAAKDSRSLVVRYEDLVRNPGTVLALIADHLHIPAGSLKIDPSSQDDALFHMTSVNAESSIGRWRRDMSQDEQETALAAFGDSLEFFGYATA
jgi:hypothetical protein